MGACPFCEIEGIRVDNTAYYQGAHRFLPSDAEERQKFAQEFKHIPALKQLQHARVTLMTMEKALREAGRDLPDKEKRWKVVPSFNKYLHSDFDFVAKCVSDPAHAISHFVVDMWRVFVGELEPIKCKEKKKTSNNC